MNIYGLYPWFREAGVDLIHPDDLAIVRSYSPYCVVCEVVGEEGQYLMLRYGDHQFRGRPQLFESIPPPAFHLRQWVRTKAPRTERMGEVHLIRWHYKRNEPSFFLKVGGKPFKSQYWTAKLEAVPAEQGVATANGAIA